jgi:cell division protein FtsX
MDVGSEILENSIRRTSLTSNLVSLVIAIITALGVCFGFYYKTNSTLESHTNSISLIREDMDKTQKQVNEIQIFKGVSSSQVESLEKKVDRIDQKLDELLMMTKRK